MELLTYEIPLKGNNHKPIFIAPVGDIQWAGNRGGTAQDTLKRHIDRCMELGAYFIGLGDYIDFLSPSNRMRLRAAALYDTAEDVIDQKAEELTHQVFDKFLKPTVGRWLGLLHGHHWSYLDNGTTTDQLLAGMLRTKFLGTSAYIRLLFKGSSTTRFSITLWAHHGCGGGAKAASPAMKLENISPYWDADIFFMGHTSKMVSAPINRITPVWDGKEPFLKHRKILLVGTGGFSKGYIQGSKIKNVPMDGYVGQKMLNPAVLGAPIAKVVPNWSYAGSRKNPEGKRISMTEWQPEITVEL